MIPVRTVAALLLAATLLTAAPSPTDAQSEGVFTLQLTPVAELTDPIAMAARAGTEDLYVAERAGIVRRLDVEGDTVTVSPTPVVNLTSLVGTAGEGGLLGLTFNPAGTKLYLHYTNNAVDTRVVEYAMNGSGAGNRVIGTSRRTVLAVDQPAGQTNHKGGTVTFGPDNRLYLALGDGGSAGDPFRNGQNLRTLLGKVLRINPNPTANAAYTSPGTNPFTPPRRREIWLYGVRNPWRISFDQDTGDLYVADVGQGFAEEVNVLPANGSGLNAGRADNLGWRKMEGDAPYNGGVEPANHTPPTFFYDHDDGGCAIVGGYVYRGGAIPALDGTYLYGDYCTGVIGGLTAVDGVLQNQTDDLGIPVPDFRLQSFGQGNDGEVYVLTESGEIYRVDSGD